MTIPNNSSAKRITVQIPTSSGDAIEAWVYLPEGSGPHPAVVMAHGIGGIKAGGLAPFAERFREEGFAAIAFDYRNFGGSGGRPREVLSVPRQRADYSTVIGWAVEQPYIDPRQIIAWGTSFAGMHVLELAVSDNWLAAAVAQAPLTDGLAAAMMSKPKNGAQLFGLALLDRVGSLFGRQPIYIPGHGRPGDLSIGATPDGPFGEKLMTPEDGTPWHDRVAARSLLSFFWRRPVRRAASVRCSLPARRSRGRQYRARPSRARSRPQGTAGRIVPQRRWPLRRLPGRSKLRRRAANGGRLPPPPRQDRGPRSSSRSAANAGEGWRRLG